MLNKLTVHPGVLLLITVLLSGCGFHLRESVELSENLQATALQGVTEFSDLDLAFKSNFNRAGYALVDIDSAQTLLKVNKNRFSRRVLSVNSAGNPNEYELTYQLSVVLIDTENKEIMSPQGIRLYRSYGYNPDVRLAKDAEENQIKINMINDAVRQVMHRISVALKNRVKN